MQVIALSYMSTNMWHVHWWSKQLNKVVLKFQLFMPH